MMIGQTIRHYKITAKLGEGGMGEVYLAEDTTLHRQVALKFLSSHALATPDAKARFIQEARAAASLEHANICAIHAIDEVAGHAYIAMAFVDGESIKEKIERGPLSIDQVRQYATETASGLKEAHDKHIIHRDIKSANIMISDKGRAKITDFGLAKLPDSSLLTQTGSVLGTAAYMSPEQVSGEAVDCRSDIWSLGVVMYEMLTARLPFRGDNAQAVAYQIINETHEPITAIRTGVPLELERIVSKCLAKDASNRYQHVDDLIVDLRNVESAAAPISNRWPVTRFLLPTITVLLFLLVVILLIQSFNASETAPAPENPLADATFTKLVDFNAQDAAISPDGKFIAFVSDRDGIFDVWIVQVGTGEVYNRTQGTAGDVRNLLQSVGFTADGTDIWIGGTPERRMRAIPLLTGPARNVLRDSVIFADWSPDGTRVVYHTHSAGDPIFVADADGSNNRAILVANPGGHQHYPAWSPDAQWIYFARGLDDNWTMDLWRVRPDGGDPEQLTEGLRDVRYPTPLDGRTVLVVARDENGAGPWLWSVDLGTKTTSRASIGVEQYSSLSSSADGRTLVATVVHPQASLWSVPILDGVATEADARRYDVQAVRAHAPRFGGDALYFLSSRGTAEGLWKRENGELTEVWNGVESAVTEPVAVNPLGTSLALVLRREGKTRLYVMNSDGSNVRHLTDDVEVHGTAAWSPDGAWIVTGGSNADGHGLFKISVSDGRVQRIVDDYAANPIWSPAEDLIIYAGKQINAVSTLYGVRSDGSPVRLPKLTVYAPDPRFRFTPDGRALVYMKGLRVSQDFRLLDLSTMKSRELTELARDATMQTFDISQDGRTIVFDRFNDNSEVVLIELTD